MAGKIRWTGAVMLALFAVGIVVIVGWSYRQRLPQMLCDAAYSGDVRAVQHLLASGAPINSRDHASGLTALAIAADRGSAPVTELLLARGADPNETSATGDTALVQASSHGNADCVKLLLAHGAKTTVRSPNGETALRAAVRNGYTDVVELLLAAGADVHEQAADGRSLMEQARLSWETIRSRRPALSRTIDVLRQHGAR